MSDQGLKLLHAVERYYRAAVEAASARHRLAQAQQADADARHVLAEAEAQLAGEALPSGPDRGPRYLRSGDTVYRVQRVGGQSVVDMVPIENVR